MASNSVADIEVRTIDRCHLREVLAIMESEGWAVDINDLELFYRGYGQHMYGAFDANGRLLGMMLNLFFSKSSNCKINCGPF